jgi:CelD/BcsL family acetyltransferase involved in cellulose biosynthesis
MTSRSTHFEAIAEAGQAVPARSASHAGATFFADVAVVRTRADFDAIAGEWLALEDECAGALFFQSTGWVRAIFDFEASRGNAAFQPIIVTLRRDGQLRAVLPLELITSPLRKMLAPLGDRYLQVSDALIADDLVARQAMIPMLKAAITTTRCDLVSLQKVRAGSRLEAGLGAAIRTGPAGGAPFERLTDWADFQSYFASLKPKTRKNMRSSRNRLARDGALTHSIAVGPDAIRDVVLRTIAGRAERLEDQGLTSRAFSDPAFADFCAQLTSQPGVELTAMSLTLNGQSLSDQWGFIHQGRYYIFMTSREFGSSEESPGKLHMKDVMDVAFQRGIDTVDFMTPVMPYKLTWCRQVTTVSDYSLPVTIKGLLLAKLWDHTLRPFAKHIFMQLPHGLRQRLLRRRGKA